MFQHFIYFIAFSLSLVYSVNGMYIVNTGPKFPPTKGEVWPKPQYERKENYFFTFNPGKLEVKQGKKLLTRPPVHKIWSPSEKDLARKLHEGGRSPFNHDSDCGLSYIGQTKRSIGTRVKEHVADIKHRRDNKSAVCEHTSKGTNHYIRFDKPQILAREPKYFPRLMREAIEISKYPNFNREDGWKIPQAWDPIIHQVKSQPKPHTARPKDTTTGQTCPLLRNAIERYALIVRREKNIVRLQPRLSKKRKRMSTVNQYFTNDVFNQGILNELEINLQSPCEDYPYYGMDESYDLTVSAKTKLTSSSIWGILRGLETWSQLFYFSDDYNEIRINKTHISDFPRYSHRGLLLDTSRHYVSLSNIFKTLEAMAMNKLNVFHWHIVDDQSFPYQSEVFPDLSAKGAFHRSMIYSKADIELVILFAKERGIRVIPEFDVPGHTRSWGNTFPEVLTECYINGKVAGLGPMNPIRNATYNILKELIEEVQQWFKDKHFHVGGDEVDLECWTSNPELRKYMADRNMTVEGLHGLFMEKVLPLLGNASIPIVWQEVYDEGVPLSADTIIQVWKGDWVNEMTKILRSGRKLIFSSSWYLDHLQSGGDWVDFYLADPREMVYDVIGKDSALLQNIVGGEACMWGEVVDDTNVISRVWPRASATAERLWSPSTDTLNRFSTLGYRYFVPKLDDVSKRLEEHTCRMRRRGIRAQPPNGPGFCVGAF